MTHSKKITIAEIAGKAGVSVATVSRILNQNSYVKPETKQKVMDVMSTLKYHPTFSGNSFKEVSNSILVCFPDFDNPFNNDVINGVQVAASNRGYKPLLYKPTTLRNSIDEYESILKKNNFCGVLLVHNVDTPERLDDFKLRYPVVMCSEHCNSSNVSFVSIDDNLAAQTAINYLLSIGRTKISLINSSLNKNYALHRERGFFEALSRSGIITPPEWITHITEINFEMAVASINNILSNPDKPDAFFCVSDVFAAAAIKAIRSNNLCVPEDISVVGFDNISLSKMTVPSITTIKQPSFEIGQQACNLLINLIENPSTPAEHLLLNTELIVRDSTAAPRS